MSDFGTLINVCGPGDGKGSTDKGVTETTIDVGTLADPVPHPASDVSSELADTAKAFTKWCNDAGGIAGRKLSLHLRDPRLPEGSPNAAAICDQDFAEVGGSTPFDQASDSRRISCGVPEIPGYDISPTANKVPRKVDANAVSIMDQQVAAYRGIRRLFPAQKKVGFLTEDLPGVIVSKNRSRKAIEQLGFSTAYDAVYPATGIENAPSYVARMRDQGMELLTVVGEPGALAAIEKAMQTIGWYPKAIVEAGNFYDSHLIQRGGNALKNTWVATNYFPLELARSNPATWQYLFITGLDTPGGRSSSFGLAAWDAWLLFATSARDCGAALTRACLMQKASAHSDWTGGGLKGPASTDPDHPRPPECVLALRAEPSGFMPDPAFLPPNQSIFNCSPANAVSVNAATLPGPGLG